MLKICCLLYICINLVIPIQGTHNNQFKESSSNIEHTNAYYNRVRPSSQYISRYQQHPSNVPHLSRIYSPPHFSYSKPVYSSGKYYSLLNSDQHAESNYWNGPSSYEPESARYYHHQVHQGEPTVYHYYPPNVPAEVPHVDNTYIPAAEVVDVDSIGKYRAQYNANNRNYLRKSNRLENIPSNEEQNNVHNTKTYEIRRPAIQNKFYDIEERIIVRPAGSALVELDHPIGRTETEKEPIGGCTSTVVYSRPVGLPKTHTNTNSLLPPAAFPSTKDIIDENSNNDQTNKSYTSTTQTTITSTEIDADYDINDKQESVDEVDGPNITEGIDESTNLHMNVTDFKESGYSENSTNEFEESYDSNPYDTSLDNKPSTSTSDLSKNCTKASYKYEQSETDPDNLRQEVQQRGDIVLPFVHHLHSPDQFFHELPRSRLVNQQSLSSGGFPYNSNTANRNSYNGAKLQAQPAIDTGNSNQEKYIDLLTANGPITHVGFSREGQSPGIYRNAGNIRARVISATPAPNNAPITGERVNTRRIVVSTPIETVQEIKDLETSTSVTKSHSVTVHHPSSHELELYRINDRSQKFVTVTPTSYQANSYKYKL